MVSFHFIQDLPHQPVDPGRSGPHYFMGTSGNKIINFHVSDRDGVVLRFQDGLQGLFFMSPVRFRHSPKQSGTRPFQSFGNQDGPLRVHMAGQFGTDHTFRGDSRQNQAQRSGATVVSTGGNTLVIFRNNPGVPDTIGNILPGKVICLITSRPDDFH